jgi:hypothetical protein
MKLWALVYEEHVSKYLDTKHLERSPLSIQSFLREIGTPSLQFGKASDPSFQEVPPGSCIRFRTPDEYRLIVQDQLYPRPDKSRRTSSCAIV